MQAESKPKMNSKSASYTPDVYLSIIQKVATEIFQKYLETKQWEQEKMKLYLDEFHKINDKLDQLLLYNKENESEMIIVEQMDKEIAKKKVMSYIKKNKTADIETLHQVIRCDIRMLVQILDELISEGKIEG